MSLRDPRNTARGFTLVEVMVASFVFLLVVLVVLLLYDSAQKSYKQGEQASDVQQTTRVGFDLMMDELRMVGYDFNRDGDKTSYPDSPDEMIEFVAPHAITIRANLDHWDGNSGRETALELPPGSPKWGIDCCPIVTTGNDEIVTFALRSEDSAANDDEITIVVDATASGIRDGYIDPMKDQPVNEETLTLTGVDLDGESPPYTLYRFTVNADGTGFDEAPIAENIRSLSFTYGDAHSLPYYCLAATEYGCSTGDQVPFATLGGGDDLGPNDGIRRIARAAIRAIHVELIGMQDAPDYQYTDRDADPGSVGDQAALHHRKFVLTSDITPPNLGTTGEPDLEGNPPDPPTNVELCGGQCDAVRVEWDLKTNTSSHIFRFFDASGAVPTLITEIPAVGQEIEGSDPVRAWAAFSAADDPRIVCGKSIGVRVIGVNAKGTQSLASLMSQPIVLTDEIRPAAPEHFTATGYDEEATGWPDVTAISIVTNPADDDYPRGDEILLSWFAPRYTLDVTSPSDPANNWTTEVNHSTYAPITCDVEMADIDGDGIEDKERTPLRELWESPRYLIFRHPTDSQFIPTDADLVAEIYGVPDPETGKILFSDRTVHRLTPDGDWFGTERVVPCCRGWFYRIRAADGCWDGTNPASTTDPHLSPFYPPLNPYNPANTDDTSTIDPLLGQAIGPAVPGYSIPSSKPAAPTDLRYSNWTALSNRYDFLVQFNAPRFDTDDPDPSHTVYDKFALYSHPTNPEFDPFFSDAGVQLHKYIHVTDLFAQHVARDDENGDTVASDFEDETNDGRNNYTELLVSVPTAEPRYYRLVPVQCEADEIAGIDWDKTAFDYGIPSEAALIPCPFGGGISSYVDVNTLDWPRSVYTYAGMHDPMISATNARLRIRMTETGESVISDSPGIPPDGLNSFTFTESQIAEISSAVPAGTPILISTEIRDSNGCLMSSHEVEQGFFIPTCCMEVGSPVARLNLTGSHAVFEIGEMCGLDPLVIHSFEWILGQENGGKASPKVFYWNSVLMGRTSKASGAISILKPEDYIRVAPGSSNEFVVQFAKPTAQGDSLAIIFNYTIGNFTGRCVFFEPYLH